eukprot:CAMPEP_0201581526 /NCGR_PEP_ID=MMETSP0190_2-20130828/70614_1 /ASSEMBLY_ACC=CAM_ASM_000263 /TAXON_ID=37353 /ORGANISM="Rosalina sp." /LENGTH=60 /DNA_ID=CAMNT_0048019719 /DNA_START=137 /DNA_END=316 /DNA_ORIENTATION=+
MGFNGPIHNIDYAILESRPGDRIMVHDGDYFLNSRPKQKNLSIIGLDEQCTMLNGGERAL